MPRPLILGHRGSPGAAPENTLRAFQAALDEGADGVELDVQLTADGVPVVIHDETLDRTTGGAGPVSALPASELGRLRAGGEPIPTLAEAMEWAAGSGAVVNVEIKHRRGALPTVAALARTPGVRTLLSSFHPEVLRELRDATPRGLRYLLTERWDAAAREAAAAYGVHGVALVDEAASAEALAQLSGAGYRAVVWTVDAADRLALLLGTGVEAVITNLPALAADLRGGR